MQDRPGQSRILRGNGDHGFPVPPSFDQTPCPAAEAILLVTQSGQDGTGTHNQKTAQVGIASLGDPSQSRLAATAVLPWHQTDPRRHLAAILEVVAVTDAGQQRAGGDRADTGTLHQALAARVFSGSLGDQFVVVGDPAVEPVGVREQITNTLVGIARQVFEMFANTPAKTGNLLRQDDAELGHQAAHPVIGRGAFFDKALSCAMQAKNDLLVFFLDRDEAHVGSGNRFADGGGVRRVVLAALAGETKGRDALGVHQLDAVAVPSKQPRLVVRAGARFQADQAGRKLGDQCRQLVTRNLGFDQNRFAVLIHTVNRKDVLGEINTDGNPTGITSGIMLMDFPFRGFKWTTSTSPFWHSSAVRLQLRTLGTGKSLSFVRHYTNGLI